MIRVRGIGWKLGSFMSCRKKSKKRRKIENKRKETRKARAARKLYIVFIINKGTQEEIMVMKDIRKMTKII